MIPATLITFLKELPWRWIGIAIALGAAIIAIDARGYSRGRHSRDGEVGALGASIDKLKAASAQATADNLTHVRQVETADEQIRKEQTDALSKERDDARAAADRYIRLHPASAADLGHAGSRGLSEAADAAGAAAQPSQPTVVDAEDVRSCTDWVTFGEGWLAWWAKVSTAPR